MKIHIFLIFLILPGCATTKNYEKVLNGWIGLNADQLAWVWGPPQSTYVLSSGDKMLTYMSSASTNSYTIMNPELNIASTYSSTEYCKTFFIADKGNTITAWHWQGTDCKVKSYDDNRSTKFPINGWSKPKI